MVSRYERFERVDMGDFNWVSPNFLAFASPIVPAPPNKSLLPTDHEEILASDLSQPFKNVLEHFYTRDVGLVVRLNSHLYPADYFTNLGIEHIDMIFDDGTCPPLNLVRKFINMAHETITVHKKHIAVHCKAGLGRTGCLIGAYLIYRYGFTANEVIAYMRFMRPGMVVGPQQHWLHLNQGDFRQWWFEDTILAAALEKHSVANGLRTPTKKRISSTTTPSRRSVLGEVDNNNDSTSQSVLPAPTPGQPRKTTSRFQGGTASRRQPSEPQPDVLNPPIDENEVKSPSRRRRSNPKVVIDKEDLERALESGMTEEEYILRLHKRVSRTPAGKRTTSYTTTVTSSVTHVSPPQEKTTRNGSGLTVKTRTSPRRQGAATSAGVRKTSATRNVSSGSITSGRAL